MWNKYITFIEHLVSIKMRKKKNSEVPKHFIDDNFSER